ncbi:hypothetical protein V1477_001135 [Vespula maculifrons]|uniref:Uncharacterized protein n=1 Tax=Vespula maculifrons TaxID=7453 RepID=A0ABD2D139_VESMC
MKTEERLEREFLPWSKRRRVIDLLGECKFSQTQTPQGQVKRPRISQLFIPTGYRSERIHRNTVAGTLLAYPRRSHRWKVTLKCIPLHEQPAG